MRAPPPSSRATASPSTCRDRTAATWSTASTSTLTSTSWMWGCKYACIRARARAVRACGTDIAILVRACSTSRGPLRRSGHSPCAGVACYVGGVPGRGVWPGPHLQGGHPEVLRPDGGCGAAGRRWRQVAHILPRATALAATLTTTLHVSPQSASASPPSPAPAQASSNTGAATGATRSAVAAGIPGAWRSMRLFAGLQAVGFVRAHMLPG